MRVILSAGGWAARAGSLRGGTRESRDEIQQVRNLLHGEAFASRRRFSCCLVRRFPRLPGGLLAPRRDPRAGEAELRRLLEPQIHRSEEHTSELQSLMRTSYAVFCFKKKIIRSSIHNTTA